MMEFNVKAGPDVQMMEFNVKAGPDVQMMEFNVKAGPDVQMMEFQTCTHNLLPVTSVLTRCLGY